jgi:hypothetical protein
MERPRPLCPIHYVNMTMMSDPTDVPLLPARANLVIDHDCVCPVSDCRQHYSPEFGYFTVTEKVDEVNAIRFSSLVIYPSTSLRIHLNPTQSICGDHEHAMYIAAFHSATKVQKFLCPEMYCTRTWQVLADAAPAYWLGEGYFGRRIENREKRYTTHGAVLRQE